MSTKDEIAERREQRDLEDDRNERDRWWSVIRLLAGLCALSIFSNLVVFAGLARVSITGKLPGGAQIQFIQPEDVVVPRGRANAQEDTNEPQPDQVGKRWP